MPASCEEEKYSGQEKIDAFGDCTLRAHSCDESINGLVARVAYSTCVAPARDEVNCPSKIEITQEEIASGGETFIVDEEDVKYPLNRLITIPKMGVCLT